MNVFLAYCETLVIYISIIVLIIIFNRKHPPFIEKEGGNKSSECYIVSVWTFIKGGHSAYREYYFVKRKNGKYRLKYSFFDWINWLIIMGVYLPLSIWIIEHQWNSISGYPKSLILSYIGILFLLAILLTILNNSKIVARIYFYKYMKGIKG